MSSHGCRLLVRVPVSCQYGTGTERSKRMMKKSKVKTGNSEQTFVWVGVGYCRYEDGLPCDQRQCTVWESPRDLYSSDFSSFAGVQWVFFGVGYPLLVHSGKVKGLGTVAFEYTEPYWIDRWKNLSVLFSRPVSCRQSLVYTNRISCLR